MQKGAKIIFVAVLIIIIGWVIHGFTAERWEINKIGIGKEKTRDAIEPFPTIGNILFWVGIIMIIIGIGTYVFEKKDKTK